LIAEAARGRQRPADAKRRLVKERVDSGEESLEREEGEEERERQRLAEQIGVVRVNLFVELARKALVLDGLKASAIHVPYSRLCDVS